MLKSWLFITVIGVSVFSAALMAEETDHFSGKPAANLEQAVNNFNQYNQRLEKALESEDMQAIHELTYTLENALARMDADLEQMVTDLEEIHLGSEAADAERVNESAARYLESVNTLKKLGQSSN